MQLISEHIAELVPPLLEGLAVTLEIMAGEVGKAIDGDCFDTLRTIVTT